MDNHTQDETRPVVYTSIETFVRSLGTKSRRDQLRNAVDAFQEAEGIGESEIVHFSLSRVYMSRTERLMQRAGYNEATNAKYARYYDEGGVDLEGHALPEEEVEGPQSTQGGGVQPGLEASTWNEPKQGREVDKSTWNQDLRVRRGREDRGAPGTSRESGRARNGVHKSSMPIRPHPRLNQPLAEPNPRPASVDPVEKNRWEVELDGFVVQITRSAKKAQATGLESDV
ncbi:hypothetical protein GGR54DRAFT_626225 [Hypoxylon sp. NC1633]|nr:hypothetical protein GGR54DRAFT_626225 [Hypoxylon sp. NC1633]